MQNLNISGEFFRGIRKIEDSPEALLDQLNRKELYIPSLDRMVSDNRKKEWLSARVLLKEMTGEEKEIAYTGTGRPYLTDHSFHISLSHTRGYVAVALSKNNPVGIDIEYLSPRIRKIRSRFISPEEDKNILPEMEDIHLLLHWSGKESIFKVLDEENVDFQEHLHIEFFTPKINTWSSFPAFETRTDHTYRFQIEYFVGNDYLLTFTELTCILNNNLKP